MSTFRTSRIDRLRRRTDGPSLTLIVGAVDRSRSALREPGPAHPAHEGFTPDGIPGGSRDTAGQASEPGSSPLDLTSRGNTSPDTEDLSTTGPGPIDRRGLLLGQIAQFLEASAGEGTVATPAGVRRIR